MKGVRFYLDHKSPANKRKGKHVGNVIAVFVEPFFGRYGAIVHEAIGPIFSSANCKVARTTVSAEYLRNSTKRISEEEARQIHPNLFKCLDE